MKKLTLLLAITLHALLMACWAWADQECRPVNGGLIAQGEVCSSDALCFSGNLVGGLNGAYEMEIVKFIPASDPTIPAISFYTGTSVLTTRQGDQFVGTDAGVIDLNPFGAGKITSLLTVVQNDHPNSFIQIRGTLDFNTYEMSGDYSGQICTP